MPGESRLRFVSVSEPSQAGQPGPGDGPLPQRDGPLPRRGGALPQRGDALPQRGGYPAMTPDDGQPGFLPRDGRPDAARQNGAPQNGQGDVLPRRGEALPRRGDPMTPHGDALPQRADPIPQRGDELLPRRPSRVKRSGRHRSPHRLTVASDAPALVLAVPGPATADSEELLSEIVLATGGSCPGVDIRVGFLGGADQSLDEAIAQGVAYPGQYAQTAVVIPLLASPHPAADAALAAVIGRAEDPVMLGAPLGPHPLLAEALHARLAQVGLARETRARGLSISNAANGALVLCDRGDDAVRAAGVAAVLLAGRLAAPAMHASIDDPQGIMSAVSRLREMGASRVAIAPCIIGPETDPREIDAVSASTGALAAPPIGAHPAIGQLVAMRYGNALVGLKPADSSFG
jgi:sirohydrochlorin ferrochelatase